MQEKCMVGIVQIMAAALSQGHSAHADWDDFALN